MDLEFNRAEEGNIALTGEIVPQGGDAFTIAIAFGESCQSTVAKLLQSLAEPFEVHRDTYVRQWQRTLVNPKYDFSQDTSDGGHMYRLSRCILLAHEDKSFQAAPILLAWRLQREGVKLGRFDPCVMILRAAAYLIQQGPVTAQERWEESAGYSPSTLATVIAGLVCAGEFAKQGGDTYTAEFILQYADWLAAHVEEWTVTTTGELVEGIPRHHVRINPTNPVDPDPHADPNTTMLEINNGGGLHPARNVVGGDFLHLVRLGIRAANDSLVRDSLAVIDRLLKIGLPQGPGWRRYNCDGYGLPRSAH